MFGDTHCHSLILAICMSLWEHVCVWHMNNAHVDLLRKCGWTTLLEPVSNTEVKTACRVFYQRCWFFLTLIIMPYVFGHALMNVKVGHTGNWLVLLGRISIPWELYFHNGWDYVMRGGSGESQSYVTSSNCRCMYCHLLWVSHFKMHVFILDAV